MHRLRKVIFALVPVLIVCAAAVGVAVKLGAVPSDIFLTGDAERTIDFGLPFEAELSADAQDVLSLNGTTLEDCDTYSLGRPITLTPRSDGNVRLTVELFGFLPVKAINVTVGERRLVYPGGQSIGVMLHTQGALVVGSSLVETEDGELKDPSGKAGLQAGDVILKVNSVDIEDAKHLSELVNRAPGGDISLLVRRDGAERQLLIEPVRDALDGAYKLGVWVRDSTAGVGTLTFFDQETGKFAGLGHAITDSDTQDILSVKDGEIIESRIIEIIKGSEGEPGELKGMFDPMSQVIGRIYKNTRFGIYGSSEKDLINARYPEPVEAAFRDEVRTGEASLLCAIDDRGVREYECYIERTVRQSEPDTRSFVVEITDRELLGVTGGIVQGMSGSPVMQDGRLVGAVTHVFVSDPAHGYGIYLDWMLAEAENAA